MLWSPVRLFVSRDILCETVFGDKAAVLQEVERVVYGSLRDLHARRLDPIIEGFGIEMPLALQYCVKDGKSFRRRPQLTGCPQMLSEYVVRRFGIHLV